MAAGYFYYSWRMPARLIAACVIFASLLLVCGHTKLKNIRVVYAADEQAVIATIRLSAGDTGSSEERERILKLEDQLAAVIKESGAGDFDGDEFGKGVCTIYMYGASADRLFAVVQPVLKKFRAPAGSYVIKRYGKPGAKQERVAIGVDTPAKMTVDATKQPAGPPRGRGPFPGSDSPGHSAGLPVRLELVVKAAELSPDGTILVDFLLTNIASDPLRLPSSAGPTSGRDNPYYLLTLWLTGDAVKKQYAVDQQTGRPFEIGIVQTSAELHDDTDTTPDSAQLAPGATMLVHASSCAQVNPGSHSITAHAVLEQITSGSAELLGTADSETLRMTFAEIKP